jgi:hypothetical protein
MVRILTRFFYGFCLFSYSEKQTTALQNDAARFIMFFILIYFLQRHGFGFEGVSLAYALTQWFGFLTLCSMIIVRKMILKSQKKRFQWISKLANNNREEKPSGNYSVLPSSSDHEITLTVGVKTAYEEIENGQKRVSSDYGKDRFALEIAAENVTNGGKEVGYDDYNATEGDREDNWCVTTRSRTFKHQLIVSISILYTHLIVDHLFILLNRVLQYTFHVAYNLSCTLSHP